MWVLRFTVHIIIRNLYCKELSTDDPSHLYFITTLPIRCPPFTTTLYSVKLQNKR